MQVVTHDDAVSMLEYFDGLDDPRSSINRQHLLGDLIVISVCGVLAGADGPKAIGVWARTHSEWLKKYLELPHGIPSHDTIGRLLAALRPAAFQACFEQWIASLREGSANNGEDRANNVEQEVIAIDGKAPLHLFNGDVPITGRKVSGRNGTAGDFAEDQRSSEPRRQSCVLFCDTRR